jgi:hydroxymethylbilane synthase
VTAVPAREDTRDVLIGRRLADLTTACASAPARPAAAMQLHDWATRTGTTLEVVPIRGNVDTRIGLAARGDLDAVVLAAAGLRRLGYLSDGDPGTEVVVSSLPARFSTTP